MGKIVNLESLSKEEFISQNKLANDCIILEPWEDFSQLKQSWAEKELFMTLINKNS